MSILKLNLNFFTEVKFTFCKVNPLRFTGLCVVPKCFPIPAWEPRVIQPSAAFLPLGCQSSLMLRVCPWVLVLSGNKQLWWSSLSTGCFSWDDKFEIHPYVSTSLQITLIYFLFFSVREGNQYEDVWKSAQLDGDSSFLPSRCWGLNRGLRAWHQAPSCADPIRWPHFIPF